MKIKVGINGMGRIGRMIVRSIVENNYSNFEIKHINNRTNSETCSNLLKYDSIHGKFNAEVKSDKNNLIVKIIKFHLVKRQILIKLIGKNLVLIMFLSVLVNLILKIN